MPVDNRVCEVELDIVERLPSRPSDDEVGLQRLVDAVISPRTGVMPRLREFRMPFCRGRLASYSGPAGLVREAPDEGWMLVGSLAWDRYGALMAALAEGVERHVWSQPSGRPARLSPEQVVRQGIPTHQFVRASEAEVPDETSYRCAGRAIDADARLAELADRPWLPGHDLSSGARRWALAGTILPAYEHPPDHGYLCDLSTNGVAAGPDRASAVVAAAAEVIERDAYMITHLARLALPEIDLATVPDLDFQSVLSRVHDQPGVRVRAWDMTLDIEVPTVLCAFFVDVDGAAVIRLGAAAHASARRAIRKAFAEAVKDVCLVREEAVRTNRRRPGPIQSLRLVGPEDHGALGDRIDYIQSLHWLLHDRPRRRSLSEIEALDCPVDEPSAVLDWFTDRLNRCGLRAYGFELTPPDVLDATGLHVWRVVVPGAQPLMFGRGVVGLASERLRWAPVRAGFRDAPLQDEDVNPLPHCFP